MKKKKKLDLATIIGVVMGFGSILLSVILEHGNLGSYINLSAAVLVFGGSFGAIFISYPMAEAKRIPGLIIMGVRERPRDRAAILDSIVHLAERARREGTLALEQEAEQIDDPLLKKGIMLVVDGTDGELVHSVMEIDIAAREARHEVGIAMFEGLGGYAPTVGILGTVMGMIRILANMNHANELGPAIAVAFTATLYGVGTANLLYLPLATKFKRRAALEEESSHMILDGVMAIQEGNTPALVREKLGGYVPPARGKAKGKGKGGDGSGDSAAGESSAAA